MYPVRRAITLAVSATLLLASVSWARNYPDMTEEGLERVKDSKLKAVYVLPEADFGGYKRIMLDVPQVSFRKNWMRDHNRRNRAQRVTEQDMARIREGLAQLFDEVFTEELAKGGYEMVTTPAPDVLHIVPKIVDLNVVAPDVMSASRVESYSESAGEMTLNLDVMDSQTGQLLARGIDPKSDPKRGYAQWQTSVTNTAAARRMLQGWATTLREGLDEVTSE